MSVWRKSLRLGFCSCARANASSWSEISAELRLEAFALAHEQNPNLKLFLHTDIDGTKHEFALPLRGLLEYFCLDDCVYESEDVLTPLRLAETYSRIDVTLSTTAGEGFGLPIVESLACGTPVIVTRNSAPQHFRVTYQVEPVVREFIPHLMSFHSWPSAEGVADMILAHTPTKLNPQELSKTVEEYQIQNVYEQNWIPFLKHVE